MRAYVSVLIAALVGAGFIGFSTPGASPTTAGKKTITKKKGVHRKTAGKKKSVQSWRAGQHAPTPDRYKLIQQALMERGYLKGQATGVWGAESLEAMKRFQREQNLEPSGKPTSLSLIALGLGPKRDLKSQNGKIRPGQPSAAGTGVQK